MPITDNSNSQNLSTEVIDTERELRGLPAEVPAEDDGWDDAAREDEGRLIHGQLIKFVDGDWMPINSTTLMNGMKLLAMTTAAAWVKYDKPVRYRKREKGRDLPARETLGDTDETLWPLDGNGEPKDPWQNTRFVHLYDPRTAEVFTLSTGSMGGHVAVNELAAAIIRKRHLAGTTVMPVIELAHAAWKTRHGMKKRPWFKVVGWHRPDSPGATTPVNGGDSHEALTYTPSTPADDLNDEIPF
jgi:hypothetical protein